MVKVDGVEFSTVDAAALVSIVRELAEERPGFVYVPENGQGGTCKYTHIDKETGEECAGCIIGAGLRKAGVLIPHGHHLNRDTTVLHLAEIVIITGDEHRVDWLGAIQDRQDFGYSWGTALEWADNNIGTDADV